MKLQFDAKQPYQLEAVSAVVDLFDGQPISQPDYATIMQTLDTPLFGSAAPQLVQNRNTTGNV